MKTSNFFISGKIANLILLGCFSFTLSAQPSSFDGDKLAQTYNEEYAQQFNLTEGWNDAKFNTQWTTVDATAPFGVSDITNGYLAFNFPAKRVMCSKYSYQNPYVFQTKVEYTGSSNHGGVVIRYVEKDNLDELQVNGKATEVPILQSGFFNQSGIAFFPKGSNNFFVQFSGVITGTFGMETPQIKIQIPKPADISDLMTSPYTLRIEDFGKSIYVYMNNNPYFRIELNGLSDGNYTSGTVYDASLNVMGTFSNMLIPVKGRVAIAQRDAALKLHNVLIQSQNKKPTSFDGEKPITIYNSEYTQTFNATEGWNDAKFNNQWTTVDPVCFTATDITNGYLAFNFPTKRVMSSVETYKSPYVFESTVDYTGGSNHGGVVVRYQKSVTLDELQDPGVEGVFNRAGIAFYPKDQNNFYVQFSGVDKGFLATVQTKIAIPKPDNVANLLAEQFTLRVEDFDSIIYVYLNDKPYIRIDFDKLDGVNYSSGTVYDSKLIPQGTFTNMLIPATGNVAIAERDALLKLYDVKVKSLKGAESSAFDGEKPTVSYTSEYAQSFNNTEGWNNSKFYNQWITMGDNCFTAADISSDCLQFSWIEKRLVCSIIPYVSPYVFQTEIETSQTGSNGGVVIRANPSYPDQLQEPVGTSGFNQVGIAFYPTDNGNSMNIQFNGQTNGANSTTKIVVSKPSTVSNLKNKGILRIEDFGSKIYVYYNNSPFARIDLGNKVGSSYSSGTVYDANMQIVGTFNNMKVDVLGKIGVAQRGSSLKLYNATVKYNDLIRQTINITPVGKKNTTDAPFTLSATSTSGLSVQFKFVSGPATLSGNTITLTGDPGIITISAEQEGNAIYYPAPDVLQTIYVSDPLAQNVSANSQDFTDNWVATDALGRELPTSEDVGTKKTDKYVGVFYYIWHGAHGDKIYDITKIIANQPADPLNPSNSAWPANVSNTVTTCFWGEPEAGYFRSEDPWVIRRDLQMLSNAHVDFLYIDVTNGFLYFETVKELCRISMEMRKEGVYTPQIIFATNAYSGRTMNQLYDKFYSFGLYDELWFKWQGKPLILGVESDTELRPEVKDFFTIKYSWAWTDSKNQPNHWQWLDTYPQDYGWSTDPNIPEQIVVSTASHPTRSAGKSYNNNNQPSVNDQYLTDFTPQGLHFAEQWKRALEVNPQVVMITQWNEWTAGTYTWDAGSGTYAGKPIKNGDIYFVDAFNQEFNRDISPMKGGHTDNYYYQMVSNIRKFKGMTNSQAFSPATTITINGDFSEWQSITPIFKDPYNDTMHRNFKGYDPTTMLTNNTGRNDVVESRTAYDDSNVYFYVKTAENLTSYTDPNWMLLYIDVDRNKGTGWEGYDYVVNLAVNSATSTTLKQWDGVNWSNEKNIPYSVVGSEMEIGIPKAYLNLNSETPQFYFHWTDNQQKLNDITSFFTDGESAPDRRFNFNFSSAKPVVQPRSEFKQNLAPGVIEAEDFDNGGAGFAYSDATLGNSGGAYRLDQSVDIESLSADNYSVTGINDNEWLEYTFTCKSIGEFTAKIKYIAASEGNKLILYIDGIDKTGVINLPVGGSVSGIWAIYDTAIKLSSGTHVLKIFMKNATNDLKIDKIEFVEKNVVYPGEGEGLNKSIWSASLGGRVWFQNLACTSIDSQINLSLSDVSPGCNVDKDFWNIRWEGQIQALYSEMYTFYLTINDMGRVWINNQLIIDGWNSTFSGTTLTGTIALTAGEKVPIKVDYAEKTGDANIKLEWSSASNEKELVPQAQLYTQNTALTDIKTSKFWIYPNPTKDKLIINSDTHCVESIKITDLQGRVVYTYNIKFIGEKTIDLNLQEGIYFIKLIGDTSFKTQKLIIE